MSRDRRPARGGFTLIELLVSMAVGMLLLAGAFEMHAAFNRQNVRQQEITDMQQALRVATQVIGRSIRTAGTGMQGGSGMYREDGVVGRPCPVPTGTPPPKNPYLPDEVCYWPVEFSNTNVYANPRTIVDTTPSGDVDPDDDWLRILSMDPSKAVRLKPGYTTQDFPVNDIRNFNFIDPFYVSNSMPSLIDGSNHPTMGWRTGCFRVPDIITPAPNPAQATPQPGTVTLTTGTRNRFPDACLFSVTTAYPGQNQTIVLYPVDRSVVFRIQPGAAGPPATPPELQAWYSRPGNTVVLPSSTPEFKTLTQNIEHMQVALILSDGTICGSATYSIDASGNTANTCNFQNVRAVRLTLVARSSSKWPGWQSQGTGGQWEDFNQPLLNDGYLRRTLTSVIEIRNDPWGVQ